jgi:hypothetical protein
MDAEDKHKFPKFFLFGIVALFLSICFVLYLYSSKSQKTKKASFIPTPTPFSVVIPQHYVDPDNMYSLNYPSSWKQTKSINSPVNHFLFTKDGQEYRFTVSPPGSVYPQGMDGTEEKEVNYGGKEFTRIIWMMKGQPSFITAAPKDITALPYIFSMRLPPQDAQAYIALFDTTLSSFKLLTNSQTSQ